MTKNNSTSIPRIKQSKQIVYICPECGVSFRALQCAKRIYCSYKCRSGHIKRQVECICLNCGKTFYSKKSLLERGGGKYCSKNCLSKRDRRLDGHLDAGEKQLYWSEGAGNSFEQNWKHQRKLALERDNGACQHCFRKRRKGESNFHIHHITPRYRFKSDYVAANDLRNLITLCPHCHNKAERGLIALSVRLF